MDARLAKNMPGRNARFAGKDPHCQSADAGQSPSVPLCGHKIECIEKEHDETLAPLARRRELIILTVDGPRRPRSL